MNLVLVWEQVVRELSAGTLSPQQRAWMRVTRPIGLLDGTALLAAPSDFAKEAIERALRGAITEALSRRLGRVVSLAVKVDSTEVVPSSMPQYATSPDRVEDNGGPASEKPPMPADEEGMVQPPRRPRPEPPKPRPPKQAKAPVNNRYVDSALDNDDGDEE